MSESKMILPEKPVFTPHDRLYGMYVDIPTKNKLKACPFCGALPAICHSEYGWFVVCLNCKTNSGSYSSEEIAEAMWNRRVENA